MASPAPISFSPSQYFDGDDGQWSSFSVRAGTPEQTFRVLPSTLSSETILPIVGACKDNQTLSIQDCASSRGVGSYQGRPHYGFQTNLSSTWDQIGIYHAETRPELRYNATALYGLDTLGLMIGNSGGPTLENQTIGAVVSQAFWLGRLGLDDKPTKFSDTSIPRRSLITTLKEEGLIPSLSYGYTAGAYYSHLEKSGIYGSLTFGGYDQSRFVPNNITFPFDADDTHKPSLSLQWIVTQKTDGQLTSLSSGSESAPYVLLDFTESQIFLPKSACDRFAQEFNLTYDSTTDLYLVDSSTHTNLLQRNPHITFRLAQKKDDFASMVDVVLPYDAFDQQISFPTYENATNYFPIRRAYGDGQYTLGRTFFQEAYIKMDYERRNFSIHQALFPTSDQKQQIVPITSVETTPDNDGKGLSKGAIAGIVVGSVLLLVIASLLGFWFCRRRRRKSKSQPKSQIEYPEIDTKSAAAFEKEGLHRVEMGGNTFPELYGTEQRAEMEVPSSQVRMGERHEVFELYESTGNERLIDGEPTSAVKRNRGVSPQEQQS